ncbi:cobalamin-dependent protein [Streptomyces brasiliensis]|uniref:B12-binding domain-containing protein n=1 Tax=Streptomyces brasiliensis TaxID=1954 RepID=A0A917PF42_9ACTN|nr:cobalamin-dependent protein [Streptomyces brasiliensis]GGJ73970.1 hypothetical protein GCM10010121_100560 [Streptomyces brasiliensis]
MLKTIHDATLRNVSASHLRVVIAPPGFDGHDRGAKVIAGPLHSAGYEVIYTGVHQTPEIELLTREDGKAVRISVDGTIPDVSALHTMDTNTALTPISDINQTLESVGQLSPAPTDVVEAAC